MSTILNTLCAIIPDPLEAWLAGGGNMTVLVLGLVGLGLYTWVRPAGGERRG
ncbi:hypothetical protein [Kocuria salsicia]|uniref:hypothetical protein n=1 Tax=Kocuria salsicia TaxID=664639 RepID=UPI001643DB25|nr:hypothetical protein [Kocuria salsicia]